MADTALGQRTPRAPKNWTFMVYMAAGQSHDLDTVAVRDLKEMEHGAHGQVNVVVQINRHWPRAAQRYDICDGASRLLSQLDGATDMGKAETLSDFVTWVAGQEDYDAKHYCLVLWGHAFGLGFGRDHENPLLLPELRAALERFKAARRTMPPGSDGRLDLLGANACSMSYAEAAYELRDVASLMAASQITVPFAGWPYEAILSRVTARTTPGELARLVVDAYVSQFDDLPGGDRLAMTVLNLHAAEPLGERLAALACAIETTVASSGFPRDMLARLRDVFMGAAAGDVRPLIDLTTLCRALTADDAGLGPQIRREAAALLSTVQPDREGRTDGALVAYHHRHEALDDLHGIGVYAPFVTDRAVVARLELDDPDSEAMAARPSGRSGRKEYEALQIFQQDGRAHGAWPRVVYDGLRRTIPADLIPTIDGIAELQAGDRADVAQIIMAIESSLNRLDRSVRHARAEAARVLAGNDTRADNASSGAGNGSGTDGYGVRAFGRPWLRLLPPLDVKEIQQARKLRKLLHNGHGSGNGHAPSAAMPLERGACISRVVHDLEGIERALANVERVTRRGLTHARFGLGLLSAGPTGLGGEPPKSGAGGEPPKSGAGGEPPKSGAGGEPPKSGAGGEPPKSGAGLTGLRPSDDLRLDLALERVAELFREVGEAMAELERAVGQVEHTAQMTIDVLPPDAPTPEAAAAATAQIVDDAFVLLEDTSANARRVVRRALAHPIYGLGPGEGNLAFDLREDLARLGGLDKRQLRLL